MCQIACYTNLKDNDTKTNLMQVFQNVFQLQEEYYTKTLELHNAGN